MMTFILLEMFVLLFLSRVKTGTSHLQDGGPQETQSDQNKQLGVKYIQIITKFALLMQTPVKENSYLRLMLLESRGSL